MKYCYSLTRNQLDLIGRLGDRPLSAVEAPTGEVDKPGFTLRDTPPPEYGDRPSIAPGDRPPLEFRDTPPVEYGDRPLTSSVDRPRASVARLPPPLGDRPPIGFEIRLDTFDSEPDWSALRAATDLPLLATWRSEPHLGKATTASREEQGWRWRQRASAAGFDLIDVELDEDRVDDKLAEIEAAGARSVLSHHELSDNSGIEPAFTKALATKASIIKIIGSGRETRDLARQREFYARAANRELVCFYMGQDYAATRILCLLYGGTFTFLTPDAGQAVAPGQLTMALVRDRLEPLAVGDHFSLFGVIGTPIGHSKSPAYHNPRLKAIDPSAIFLALPAATSEDLTILRETFEEELTGLAVTKPMKGPAYALEGAQREPLIEGLGAANTLLFDGMGVRATNTDLLAMKEILARVGDGPKVRVLGYGGLGKAVVRACRALSLEVEICNRTPGKVDLTGEGITELVWSDRHAPGADVIVQATAAGMAPNEDTTPLDTIPEGVRLIIETVYNPLETRLMRMAREAGTAVLDGMTLFNGQARIQSEFFLETLKRRLRR